MVVTPDLLVSSRAHAREAARTGNFPRLSRRITTGNYRGVTPLPARQDPNGGGDGSIPDWFQAFLDAQAAGGAGSFGSSEAGMRLEAELRAAEEQRMRDYEANQALLGRQFEEEQNRKQREFQAEQERQRRELERQAQLRDLQNQRQAQYVDLIGRDPARAVLFAMGIGPEADKFNVMAKSLGATVKPLAGAEQQAQTTSSALEGILAGQGGGHQGGISFGAGGISGLGNAAKSATAFQQSNAPGAQNLLTSAFGVGGQDQPGLRPEDYQRLIQSVTPQGAAAKGA